MSDLPGLPNSPNSPDLPDSPDLFLDGRTGIPALDVHQPGVKLDSNKVRLSLLMDFSLALKGVGEVATYGAEKYTPGGWQSVENGIERYYDAFFRHLLNSRNESVDLESGLPHLHHALWNLLAVVELSERSIKEGQ